MKYISIQELADMGLLFEVNRRVLHPLGLAIAINAESDKETGEVTSAEFGGVWDCQDDPEGLYFTEETFISGMAKFLAYMEAEGNEKLAIRAEALGYVVQGE